MTAQVSRAEKLMEKLAVRTGMTEKGKNWLIAAIDPFHDGPLDVTGYPDATTGSSIVQVIKQSTQIASVTGLAYDCLIRSDNFLTTDIAYNATLTGDIVSNPATSTSCTFVGGIQCITGNVNANLSVVPFPQVPTTGFLTANLKVPNSYVKRRFRLIGMGFEVHNITAELNKQGSVTVFEQSQSRDPFTTLFLNTANTTILGSFSSNWVQQPPTSLSNSLLLQGSKTWDASQGAYCVCTMSDVVNPPRMAEVINPLSISIIDNNYPNIVGGTCYIPGTTTQTAGSFSCPAMNICTPYNSKGMYFSNLSATTVLQVNAVFIIERFPSEIDGDLTVLATPTADYDPIALEAYSRLCRLIPVGVPVNQNGFGDWFFGEVSSLIDCMTGTNFAGGINKSLSKWADRDKNPDGNDWVESERPVRIVRSKPKAIESSFTKTTTVATPKTKNKGMLYADKSRAQAALKRTGGPVRYAGPNGKVIILKRKGT